MLSADFWKGAAERAVKSFFQTFVAVVTAAMGAEALGVSAGLLDVSWLDALSVACLTAVLSVATSIGNADFTAGREPVQVQIDTDAVIAKINENPDAYLLADETPGKHRADPVLTVTLPVGSDIEGELDVYVDGEKVGVVTPTGSGHVTYQLPSSYEGKTVKVSLVHGELGLVSVQNFRF